MGAWLTLDSSDYLSPEQLALFLGVNTDTLKKWRSVGKGPTYVKLGRRPLYPRHEVLDWIERQKRNGNRAQGQPVVYPLPISREGASRTHRFGSHQGKHGPRERAREAAETVWSCRAAIRLREKVPFDAAVRAVPQLV